MLVHQRVEDWSTLWLISRRIVQVSRLSNFPPVTKQNHLQFPNLKQSHSWDDLLLKSSQHVQRSAFKSSPPAASGPAWNRWRYGLTSLTRCLHSAFVAARFCTWIGPAQRHLSNGPNGMMMDDDGWWWMMMDDDGWWWMMMDDHIICPARMLWIFKSVWHKKKNPRYVPQGGKGTNTLFNRPF